MQVFVRLLMLLMALGACSNEHISTPRKQPSDDWLISATISDKNFNAQEILAIGMDASLYRTHVQPDQSFTLKLPGNSFYAIYVIPNPELSSDNAALLTFDDGSSMRPSTSLRLPKTILEPYLNLGSLDIKNNEAWPTRNPAKNLDFDNDGLVDIIDNDDQNDGLSDADQKWQSEKVGLCHREDDHYRFILAPLSTLLAHLQHGDKVGKCGHSQDSL